MRTVRGEAGTWLLSEAAGTGRRFQAEAAQAQQRPNVFLAFLPSVSPASLLPRMEGLCVRAGGGGGGAVDDGLLPAHCASCMVFHTGSRRSDAYCDKERGRRTSGAPLASLKAAFHRVLPWLCAQPQRNAPW